MDVYVLTEQIDDWVNIVGVFRTFAGAEEKVRRLEATEDVEFWTYRISTRTVQNE